MNMYYVVFCGEELKCSIAGGALYACGLTGIFGDDPPGILETFLFSSLIVAVDPVSQSVSCLFTFSCLFTLLSCLFTTGRRPRRLRGDPRQRDPLHRRLRGVPPQRRRHCRE